MRRLETLRSAQNDADLTKPSGEDSGGRNPDIGSGNAAGLDTVSSFSGPFTIDVTFGSVLTNPPTPDGPRHIQDPGPETFSFITSPQEKDSFVSYQEGLSLKYGPLRSSLMTEDPNQESHVSQKRPESNVISAKTIRPVPTPQVARTFISEPEFETANAGFAEG